MHLISGRSSFRRKGSRLPKQWRREMWMATFITVLGSLNCQVWFNHWTLDRQSSSGVAVGVPTHPVGGIRRTQACGKKRPLVRPLGPGGDLKCRFGATRCRSLMQQLHAGVERKEQYKTFAIRTNLSTKGHLPSSSNSTAQDKLPSPRVLRQSSRLAVQSPMPLPSAVTYDHFEDTYLQVSLFWWNGMAAGPLHRDDIHWVRSPDGVLLWMSYSDTAKGLFLNAPSEMATGGWSSAHLGKASLENVCGHITERGHAREPQGKMRFPCRPFSALSDQGKWPQRLAT